MGRLGAILLILWLVPLSGTLAQPARSPGADGTTRLVAEPSGLGERLVLRRGRERLWSARDQGFEAWRDGAPLRLGPAAPEAIGVTGWSGGAYCCWTLHLFQRGPQGLRHVASLPLGKRDPTDIRLAPPGGPPILLADAAFDFWEAPVSLAADLGPTIPFRWTGQALRPDLDAMRRPVAAALGTACAGMMAPGDLPAPEARIATYPDSAAAIAALRARDWGRPRGNEAHPGVEAARLAACLIYSGQAEEAQRLLRAAWPDGAPGLAETERQLAARLACSPFAAAVRSVNPPGAPFTRMRCRPEGPEQTAVFALDWR